MAVIEDQDLVVGLPRSREVHAVNGMDVGPDGWLYLTVGGNTNASRWRAGSSCSPPATATRTISYGTASAACVVGARREPLVQIGRVVVQVGTATGGRALQLGLEVGGVFTEYARIALTGAIANLDLFVTGRPGSGTVTAYYDVNATGVMKPVGATVTVPGAWFSSNTLAGNRSLTGVICSDGAAQQIAFVFDFFKIDRVVP